MSESLRSDGAAVATDTTPGTEPLRPRLWVEHITLTAFRNYERTRIETRPGPVVLVGANGAGKTNFLEALSLLAPGQGLRRASLAEIARDGEGAWAVAARAHTRAGICDIGTGLTKPVASGERLSRHVRIDGEVRAGTGVLAELVEVLWVTPAMDGLFTGPAGDRRRFLDRLIICLDPAHAARCNRYERAMQARNRLLADGVREPAHLAGFEVQMAETGVAIAAARAEIVAALGVAIGERRARQPQSPFPWAELMIEGEVEAALLEQPALDVEEALQRRLRETRERDRGAGRTLDGPHRSDLVVRHGPKDMPARLSSTGEQKALLVGLMLAHAELLTQRHDGFAPIVLLDEITAHLDRPRREALFADLLRLGCQAWMTGTDADVFEPLRGRADIWRVEDGRLYAG